MREDEVLKRAHLDLSKAGFTLFRNNVAGAWTGERFTVTMPQLLMVMPGDVLLRKARPLQAGLIKGSSDLIGWRPLKVVQELIGRTIAQFVAIECKGSTGRATEEQKQFLDQVALAGGYADLVGPGDLE